MEDGDILMGYSFHLILKCLTRQEMGWTIKSLLRETLIRTNGNKAQCAKILGVSRKTLYQWIKKYGLN